jgi:nucleoside-diphosphate-sugar epimerase
VSAPDGPQRVLVTGAGLVGCHAAADLRERGHDVALLDRRPDEGYVAEVAGAVEVVAADVTDLDALRSVLRARGVTAVVHTAGIVGPKAEQNPYLAFVINTHGTATVVEACREQGVRRLVHVSSLAVYDWGAAAGLSSVPELVASGPATSYGATKVAAEAIVRSYGHRGWLEPTILRLAGVYGRGHYRGGSMLGALVDRALRRCLAGEPAELSRALGPCELLYAADAGRAVRLAIERADRGSALCNVGSGVVTTPAELAAALARAVPGGQVRAHDSAEAALPLDLTRARTLLGYVPRYTLDDGLADLAGRLAGVLGVSRA